MSRCELTHVQRAPIDLARARAQHEAYVAALEECDVTVTRLDAPADQSDAVFIEDTAVVLPEIAVLARPGAASRRGEVEAVAAALTPWRCTIAIESPATLDGGDVLVIGHRVYVGRTGRTNGAGVAQLASALAPFGYAVTPVVVSGCLHLKSAATMAAPGTLVLNPAWVDGAVFAGLDLIAVHPDEPWAANVLALGDVVLHAATGARTAERVAALGVRPLALDISELAKAEGGMTCCSLLIA